MIKRLFDIIFSIIGLFVALPLMAVIVLMIKRESKGPTFYMGDRIGQHGKPFKMFKFRTMVMDADKIGGPSTAGDDPRLTETGKFLKKFQFDELPQLINVLSGEMSIVGPRPEVPYYVEMMAPEEKELILSVPQGMTDLASLWDFHEGEILKGSVDPEKTYQAMIRPEKLRLQMEYARTRTFWLDIKIIVKTILKIFR